MNNGAGATARGADSWYIFSYDYELLAEMLVSLGRQAQTKEATMKRSLASCKPPQSA